MRRQAMVRADPFYATRVLQAENTNSFSFSFESSLGFTRSASSFDRLRFIQRPDCAPSTPNRWPHTPASRFHDRFRPCFSPLSVEVYS